MKFVNLTPHKIVYDDGERREEFEPSGEILRLEYEEGASKYFDVNGLECVKYNSTPIITVECANILNEYFVNAAYQDIFYIVSNPVAKQIASSRFIAPDTNPQSVIRDSDGDIVAVKRFCRYV